MSAKVGSIAHALIGDGASEVQAITSPIRFCSAALLAMRMMRGSYRPAVWHLIYLAEACWIKYVSALLYLLWIMACL
jgi:hypothetical protein